MSAGRVASPAPPRPKPVRQRAILDLVASGRARTQDEIVAALADRHLDATQATVSRDIRELGLLRVAGDGGTRYVVGGGEPERGLGARLDAVLREHVRSVEFVASLGVVRVRPSTAPLVAAALDGAALDEVAGTIAGDDTVLVVARGRAQAARLVRRLRAVMGAP